MKFVVMPAKLVTVPAIALAGLAAGACKSDLPDATDATDAKTQAVTAERSGLPPGVPLPSELPDAKGPTEYPTEAPTLSLSLSSDELVRDDGGVTVEIVNHLGKPLEAVAKVDIYSQHGSTSESFDLTVSARAEQTWSVPVAALNLPDKAFDVPGVIRVELLPGASEDASFDATTDANFHRVRGRTWAVYGDEVRESRYKRGILSPMAAEHANHIVFGGVHRFSGPGIQEKLSGDPDFTPGIPSASSERHEATQAEQKEDIR